MMSAPDARTSSGRIALTVAAVPTGMNAGVRISPRSMAMTPVRAAPSVAAMEKAKRVTGCAMPSALTEVEQRRPDIPSLARRAKACSKSGAESYRCVWGSQ